MSTVYYIILSNFTEHILTLVILFCHTQQQVEAVAMKSASEQVNSDGATSERNSEKLMHLLKETLNELKEQ